MAAEGKPGRGSDQFPLRLPEGMRDRIKAAAQDQKRSMNSEIVERLAFFEIATDIVQRSTAEVKRLELEVEELTKRAELAEANGIVLPSWLRLRVEGAAAQKGRDYYQEVIQALETVYPPPPITFGQYMEVLRDAFADGDIPSNLKPIFEGLLQSYEAQAKRDPGWVNKYPAHPVPHGGFPMNFEATGDEK